MANHTISDNQLTENTLICVQGTLGFSRLASRIEGKELEADNLRKQNHGITPVGRPYTTVTIHNAEVLSQDPNNPTIEDKFVAERMYTSKDGQGGKKYSINNTGSILPIIAVINKQTGAYDEITPKSELANGLKVVLVLRVYKSKNYNRKSLSLQRVLVQEPIRYFSGSQIDDQMAARGITINALSDAERSEGQKAAAQAAEAAFDAQMKAPQANQVSAPTGDPFANAGAQPVAPAAAPANAFTAPAVETPAPDANAPWKCPSCGASVPGSMRFCGTCGTAKPAGNPYAPDTTVNDRGTQGGIIYDASERNY